jgi:hypothetical protein
MVAVLTIRAPFIVEVNAVFFNDQDILITDFSFNTAVFVQ